MKKLLSVCLLMLCLSFPAFAGHTVAGERCADGTAGCIPDAQTNGSQQNESSDLGSELLLVMAVLMTLLRYKA